MGRASRQRRLQTEDEARCDLVPRTEVLEGDIDAPGTSAETTVVQPDSWMSDENVQLIEQASLQESLDTDGIDEETPNISSQDFVGFDGYTPTDVTLEADERHIRLVTFDEEGVLDYGRVPPESLGQLLGDLLGEPQEVAPVEPESGEALDHQAEMTSAGVAAVAALLPATAEPRPRMDPARMEMRVRICPQWVARCPKRLGTQACSDWAHYVDGMTVSAYLASHDRRRARANLRWDEDHEFIRLQSTADYMTEVQASREDET
jgi:hypothetical protein